MANPEMPGVQQRDLGAVPPQGRPELVEQQGSMAGGDESTGGYESAAGSREPAASTAAFVEPSGPPGPPGPSEQSETMHARRTPPPPQPTASRLPLLARVLLADLGVVIVALIALTVVEVQRLGDASLHLRRQAYAEDLVILFLVAAVFGVVAYLLLRAGRTRVAIVQAVVAALVLGVAVTSAVAGNPKATQVTPVDQDQ
jgi:hypothetical protein